jgi:hypothetical protein
MQRFGDREVGICFCALMSTLTHAFPLRTAKQRTEYVANPGPVVYMSQGGVELKPFFSEC